MRNTIAVRNEPMYLAAIVHDEDSSTAQKVLDACIGRLKAQGVCVQGLNNAVYVREDGCTDKCVMSLDGLHTYLIFQDLGTESQSCRLNPAVLAEAATVLHEARSNRPDLVIINRFGVVEARGEGLVQEFADLVSDGLPVLTLLNRKYLRQWQEFTGGMAEILPAEEAAVNDWLRRIGVIAGRW
ncbi:DUF2478 domain-containing protein [Neisseria sp. MVDL19-042950]|nr:DUF2478 domain-containing protein [Neisseria sp. MVDL19-042950]